MFEGVKLLRIKYNNKLFDVFINEKHTKEFLEVKIEDGKEKFYHPNLHDLINLNLIYNTKIDKKYSDKRKKYKFKLNSIKNLKIRYQNLKKFNSLIKQITRIAICGAAIILIKDKLDNTTMPELAIGSIEIKNNNELDTYEIKNVSFDEIKATVAQNDNITSKYKEYINEYISLLEEKLPKIDLRILNENLKDMQVIVYYGKQINIDNVAGAYDANTNTLEICTGYEDKTLKNIIFHELTHATTTLNSKVSIMNAKIICNQRVLKQYEEKNNYGEALDEGFTEVLTNYLLSNSKTLDEYYKEENRKFLGYSEDISPVCYDLLKITQDEYTLYDFVNGNVKDYNEILKKYELNGIIDYLDAIKQSDSNKIEIINSYEFKEYLNKIKYLIEIKNKNINLNSQVSSKVVYTLSKEFK